LGWREIGGRWLHLHAGGAICPDGVVADVEVDLPRESRGYVLPAPPESEALRVALRASLRLLEVARDPVSIPLLSTVCRAPLGDASFSAYLVGRTGVCKTSLAALAQSHFSAGMDFGDLPADWTSTANYLEVLAFAAKDVLLTVDDFIPRGGGAHRDRQQREADRLLRRQANRSGRGRLRADSTPRPPRPPRGLIVATGEDLPRGESLGARPFAVEVRMGDVDLSALTVCQADATAGLYASAMAGYVRWLAARYGQVMEHLADEVRQLRAALLPAPSRCADSWLTLADTEVALRHCQDPPEGEQQARQPLHTPLGRRAIIRHLWPPGSARCRRGGSACVSLGVARAMWVGSAVTLQPARRPLSSQRPSGCWVDC